MQIGVEVQNLEDSSLFTPADKERTEERVKLETSELDLVNPETAVITDVNSVYV